MPAGSVVATVGSSCTASGHGAGPFAGDEFAEMLGRRLDMAEDHVGVVNADGSAENPYPGSVTRFPSSGNVWVGVPGGSDGTPIGPDHIVVPGGQIVATVHVARCRKPLLHMVCSPWPSCTLPDTTALPASRPPSVATAMRCSSVTWLSGTPKSDAGPATSPTAFHPVPS